MIILLSDPSNNVTRPVLVWPNLTSLKAIRMPETVSTGPVNDRLLFHYFYHVCTAAKGW